MSGSSGPLTLRTKRSWNYQGPPFVTKDSIWRGAEPRNTKKGQLLKKLVEPLGPAAWETGSQGADTETEFRAKQFDH